MLTEAAVCSKVSLTCGVHTLPYSLTEALCAIRCFSMPTVVLLCIQKWGSFGLFYVPPVASLAASFFKCCNRCILQSADCVVASVVQRL